MKTSRPLDVPRLHEWTAARAPRLRRRWSAALVAVPVVLAAFLLSLLPTTASAQSPDDINVKGKRPGVIDFGKDEKKTDKPGDKKDGGDDKKGDANNPLSEEEIEIEPNFDPPLGEEDKPIPNRAKVTIDFRKAELESVVKFYSKLLKKNFIIADSLRAGKKITIIAPRQVTVNEAYRAFLAALAMNGLTIVPHGAFLKIVDSKDASKETIPTRRGRAGVGFADVMETRLIPIEHVSHTDVEAVLSKIKSKDAEIISYAQTNTLIITEYASNMRRMFRIINFLDQPTGAEKIHIYQVQYADAGELASKLTEIFEVGASNTNARARTTKGKKTTTTPGEDPGEVSASKIIADENTNQLIILANNRSYRQIVELIEKLDIETNAGRIWVYPLEHANAEELSQVLSNLANQSGSGNRRTSGRTTRRTTGRDGNTSSSSGASTAAAGAALLSGDVQVTADQSTNSLIIVASFKDYVALRTVVEQLDKRRKQVYVEAAVLELSLNRNRRFGIGLNAGFPREFGFIPESDNIGDEGLILAQANFQGAQLLEAIQGQGGLGVGIIGPSVSIPGTDFSLPAFLFFLEANQIDQDVNILSTPSLLTLNNEEAEISVGERVPFLTNTGAGALGGLGGLAGGLGGLLGGAGGTTGTDLGSLGGLGTLGALGGLGGLGGGVQYEDVTLTLRIIPQINSSGLVRLEVNLTVDELKPGAGDSLTPTTTTRDAKTVVVAEDQQTIVIGGLMRDVENEGVVKVPFLGDIPVLGVFFRRTDTTITKQNLVLLLTPYIITSEEDMRRITEEKREERARFIELFGRRDKGYFAKINYGRKRGLLEEMNRRLIKAEDIEDSRRRAYDDPNKFPRDSDNNEPDGDSGDDIIITPDEVEE